MKGKEFLNRLRKILLIDFSKEKVKEIILYYDEYICDALEANDKTEEEIIGELGGVYGVLSRLKKDYPELLTEEKIQKYSRNVPTRIVMIFLWIPLTIVIVSLWFSLVVTAASILFSLLVTFPALVVYFIIHIIQSFFFLPDKELMLLVLGSGIAGLGVGLISLLLIKPLIRVIKKFFVRVSNVTKAIIKWGFKK
jgi:uncharacterized membrane protein